MATTAGHRGDLGVSAFQVEETGRSLLVKTHLVGRLSGATTVLPIFKKMDWHMTFWINLSINEIHIHQSD